MAPGFTSRYALRATGSSRSKRAWTSSPSSVSSASSISPTKFCGEPFTSCPHTRGHVAPAFTFATSVEYAPRITRSPCLSTFPNVDVSATISPRPRAVRSAVASRYLSFTRPVPRSDAAGPPARATRPGPAPTRRAPARRSASRSAPARAPTFAMADFASGSASQWAASATAAM
jgi:hypothetical protein